jgi:hypothetical protein
MSTYPETVRIRSTEDTRRLGLADRQAKVLGFTTPSVTGVSVIGPLNDDFAWGVSFGDGEPAFWLADELVEKLDR